jgi:hypothetical protein
MKNSNTVRADLFALILLVGLGCFLWFNYMTTLSTLDRVLGDTKSVTAFAIAISMVDFAGIARVFTPETNLKDESIFVYVMLGVWMVAAFVDIILTWWWVALQMSNAGAAAHIPEGIGGWMLELFPWAVAFMEFAIRVPLVLLVGQYGDRLLHIRLPNIKRSSAQRPSMPNIAHGGGMPVPPRLAEYKTKVRKA